MTIEILIFLDNLILEILKRHVYNDLIKQHIFSYYANKADIIDEEVFIMLKEITYTIRPDKSEEFFKKLYSTAPSKKDWERIKKESQVLDKERLDALFEEDDK